MSQPNLSDPTDAGPAPHESGADHGMTLAPGPGSRRARGVAVNWRKTARIVVGAALVLLGLLWILQGADLVRIRPILCVADCRPITGGSPGWLAIGVATSVVGLAVVGVLRRRR